LELLTALIVAFEAEKACPAAFVLDGDGVDRVSNATAARGLSNETVARNEPRTECIDWPKKTELDDIAGGFRCVAGCPPINRLGEPPAFPPIGIITRQMQGCLVAARAPGLPDTVRSHKGALGDVWTCPKPEELHVLGVEFAAERPIVRIHIEDAAALLTPFRLLQQPNQFLLFRGAERVWHPTARR